MSCHWGLCFKDSAPVEVPHLKGRLTGNGGVKEELLEEKTEIYSIMQDIQAFERDLEASTKTTEDHSGM